MQALGLSTVLRPRQSSLHRRVQRLRHSRQHHERIHRSRRPRIPRHTRTIRQSVPAALIRCRHNPPPRQTTHQTPEQSSSPQSRSPAHHHDPPANPATPRSPDPTSNHPSHTVLRNRQPDLIEPIRMPRPRQSLIHSRPRTRNPTTLIRRHKSPVIRRIHPDLNASSLVVHRLHQPRKSRLRPHRQPSSLISSGVHPSAVSTS